MTDSEEPEGAARPPADETVGDGEQSAYAPFGKPLSSSLALTVDEANVLAGDAGATLVMPLGPVKVGKTTLAVELYARYLRIMRWAGCSFAGSETLLDYEMLAFPSRLTSGGDLPDTWRTRLGGERHLLHLRLATDGGRKTNLLFANLSGEISESIRDGGDPISEMPMLARAHRILVCVDGERIASPALAGRAVSGTRQLIGTLQEKGSFIGGAEIALVLTKYDKVVASGQQTFWHEAGQELTRQIADLGLGDVSFRTAARPDQSPPADDETEALMRWLVRPVLQPASKVPASTLSERALGRFVDHKNG